MKKLRLVSHMAYRLLELSDKYEDEFESCMEGSSLEAKLLRLHPTVTEKQNCSLTNEEGAFQLSLSCQNCCMPES